jgi:hypothetical protein
MTAVNLFLVLDTLADLLGLLAILQAWSYVMSSSDGAHKIQGLYWFGLM